MSSMALARLLVRWTPRYSLGATLKKDGAQLQLSLQHAHERSGNAYPGCIEMTGASFVGPNPIPPLWWKSSCTSCGSCAGSYVGLAVLLFELYCALAGLAALTRPLSLARLAGGSTFDELYGTCSLAGALDSALLVGRNSEKGWCAAAVVTATCT